jgi:ATP-dependent Lon protease
VPLSQWKTTAFTGELLANENVKEIGGVVEKVLACVDTGVPRVFVSNENVCELMMMSGESKRRTTVIGSTQIEYGF